MQDFLTKLLIAVMTSDEVKAMLHDIIHEAVHDGIGDLEQTVDGLDGKMGNLEEQLLGMPAKMVGQITTPLIDAINRLNPLGGLFGH